MSVRRAGLAAALAVLAAGCPNAAALGLTLPSTVTLSNLGPGRTATSGNVSMTIASVVLPWALTVTADPTTTPGHLRATSGTCGASSETALTSPLHLATSTTLATTTIDQASLDFGSATVQIAHGTAADTLTLAYTQPVAASEKLQQGCVYTTNITFTVQ